MNNKLWKDVMSMKENDTNSGVANSLNRDDVTTILATMDYWGAGSGDLTQAQFDLLVARYRVFDWLAMGVMSANQNPRIPLTALRVLVHSFLKSNGCVSDFIEDLRFTDYEIDRDWESIQLEDEEGGEK